MQIEIKVWKETNGLRTMMKFDVIHRKEDTVSWQVQRGGTAANHHHTLLTLHNKLLNLPSSDNR
ncbi:hypothetical protein A7K69_16870 [Parageobacillus thermoglucosidasius]|uniref:Uncharacterized protein n=1 Tax=Parageobacillus thermoglucosidasius TaxID=1426 RepID=A0A1B7KV50_PARTM|nr:hypothetical protein A7K69_16870 [Parageobacillus thermoglucosidasius]